MAAPSPSSWAARLGELKKAAGRGRAVKFPRPLVLADKVSNRPLKQGDTL